MSAEVAQPEPWLRGTLTEVPAVQRGVLHALELAKENLQAWCAPLSDVQLNFRYAELPSIAFHVRHVARSLDRLLSYAEGKQLSEAQLAALRSEAEPGADRDSLFEELNFEIAAAMLRVKAFAPADLEQPRLVGRKQLPTTVVGLLVHVADHTQRHVGQAITTAKIVVAQHGRE
jgi:uncharacterized damage-inducible protein DinB